MRTAVGYTGGTSETPNYHRIGDHSEALQVEFDPQQLNYAQLLDVFWESHDPGYKAYRRQYRNAVFYLNEKQGEIAADSRQRIDDGTRDEIFTEIEPAGEFFVAEDYHQKHLLRQATGILQEFQEIYPEDTSLTVSTAAARINGYLGCNGEASVLERELESLGLSEQMQTRLAEHVASSCDQFAGLTCPSRN